MLRRIKRDASVFLLLPLLIAGFSLDADSAPFTNGSFEQASVNPGNDRITLDVGDTSISGWIVTAGQVDYTGGTYWQHSDGVRGIDVNGETQGALAQQFDTVVGQTYDVNFDMAGNPDGGPGIKYLLVTAPGFSQQFTFDTTGFSRADMGWSNRSFSFTADSSTSTILFESQTFDACCYGPVLDNVRVAVPVPVIASVMVTNNASLQIDITGDYLSNGSDAVVSLGTVGTLSVDFQSSSELVASAFTPVPYGDYLLTLTNGFGSVTYDLTLGAVGPAGPPGPPGGLTSDTGRNTAAGTDALASNTTGISNSAFGRAALRDNTTGTRNTAIGNAALINNTTGQRNTATGETALRNNVSGFGNTATGSEALRNNSDGDSNTAMGFRALGLNQTGDWNTAIGSNALFKNTTASYNTASGAKALYSNTKGFHNTASGAQALRQNTTGSDNTASGTDALLQNTVGSFNTASGAQALRENTFGLRNTAIGYTSLRDNTTGSQNTAIGARALLFNTTGSSNIAVGETALLRNRTGSINVAMGPRALENNETGRLNVAIGPLSLLGNGSGDGNIALGFGAGIRTNGNDNIVIGNDGVRGESGTIRIGDADQTRAFMAGINGNDQSQGMPVFVGADGQLGTAQGPGPAGTRCPCELSYLASSSVLWSTDISSFVSGSVPPGGKVCFQRPDRTEVNFQLNAGGTKLYILGVGDGITVGGRENTCSVQQFRGIDPPFRFISVYLPVSAEEASACMELLDSVQTNCPTLEPPSSEPTSYAIGDTGPAGGVVFHVTDGGLHGLEAAPVDQGIARWGCFGTVLAGANGTLIGTGAQNTADIIAECAERPIAASVAADYISPSGHQDWYLPSKDDLGLMYDNIGLGNASNPNIGGFAPGYYQSSSERDGDNAWGQNLGDERNFQIAVYKTVVNAVRAVRDF